MAVHLCQADDSKEEQEREDGTRVLYKAEALRTLSRPETVRANVVAAGWSSEADLMIRLQRNSRRSRRSTSLRRRLRHVIPATAAQNRAPLNIAELSAMALIRSSGTHHFDDECLARRDIKGVHDPQESSQKQDFPHLDVPKERERRKDEREEHRGGSGGDPIRCRLCRSANNPPRGAKRSTGICPEKPASPRSRGDFVRR